MDEKAVEFKVKLLPPPKAKCYHAVIYKAPKNKIGYWMCSDCKRVLADREIDWIS